MAAKVIYKLYTNQFLKTSPLHRGFSLGASSCRPEQRSVSSGGIEENMRPGSLITI